MFIMDDIPDSNVYSFFFSRPEAYSQQIVARPSHWGEQSSSALREDVQNFDRDIDATFEDAPPQTINPALLLPMASQPLPVYYPPTSPSTDTATVSSTTSWCFSEASSPPTSPEYTPGEDSCVESQQTELSANFSQQLSEEQVQQLLRELFGDSPVGMNTLDTGTPSFASPQPATAPAYSTPFINCHEPPQQQHPGAAVAGVHGLGTGMQVTALDSDLTGAWSAGGQYSLTVEQTPSVYPDASQDPVKHAPYSHTKAVCVPRKASTHKNPKGKPVKNLPCPRSGCPKGVSDVLLWVTDTSHVLRKPFHDRSIFTSTSQRYTTRSAPISAAKKGARRPPTGIAANLTWTFIWRINIPRSLSLRPRWVP